jgi:hypothetical protein
MLTRRSFGNFASCALCAMTGFVASDASAQTPSAATSGVKRKMLSEIEGPVPGYVTISVEAEIEAGATVGRHTHPGTYSRARSSFRFRVKRRGSTRLVKASRFLPQPRMLEGRRATSRSRLRSRTFWRKVSPLPRRCEPALREG